MKSRRSRYPAGSRARPASAYNSLAAAQMLGTLGRGAEARSAVFRARRDGRDWSEARRLCFKIQRLPNNVAGDCAFDAQERSSGSGMRDVMPVQGAWGPDPGAASAVIVLESRRFRSPRTGGATLQPRMGSSGAVGCQPSRAWQHRGGAETGAGRARASTDVEKVRVWHVHC